MKIPNYKILKEIGSGGMGTVYLAKHELIARKVAIKSLKQDLINNEQLKERFKKEATALAKLEHPNIVRLNEYIEQQDGVFLIMEYVDGLTLDEHINNVSGPINEKQLIPLFLQILDAFEYAHKNKIVHRDIKPSNIIITKDGKIKVLDFGIAKIMNETNSLTKSGTQMGSVFYMSPEQVRGEKVNHLSDIYSLGVTLFQMASGKAPYNPDSNEYQIFQKIDKEPLPNISSIYPGHSERINDIIQKATAKNATDRFQSCQKFKNILTQKEDIGATIILSEKTAINKTVNSSFKKNKSKKESFIIISTIIIITSLILYNLIDFKSKISYEETTFDEFKYDEEKIPIIYYKNNMKPVNGYLTYKNEIMGEFVEGIPDGTLKFWYKKENQLMFEAHFLDKKREGHFYKWSSNGQLIESFFYVNGKKDGIQREWSFKGDSWSQEIVLDYELNYKDGKLDGICTNYWNNGQQMDSGRYELGLQVGLWKHWYENGELRKKYNYKDGKLDGICISYHYKNGQQYDSGRYELGLQVGLWKYWYKNGQLKAKGKFLRGNGLNRDFKGVHTHKRDKGWSFWRDNGEIYPNDVDFSTRYIYRGSKYTYDEVYNRAIERGYNSAEAYLKAHPSIEIRRN